MWYIAVFSVVAIVLVVAVLVQRSRKGEERVRSAVPHGTDGASRTHSGSAERRERKRRRAQSQHDRRKRH